MVLKLTLEAIVHFDLLVKSEILQRLWRLKFHKLGVQVGTPIFTTDASSECHGNSLVVTAQKGQKSTGKHGPCLSCVLYVCVFCEYRTYWLTRMAYTSCVSAN